MTTHHCISADKRTVLQSSLLNDLFIAQNNHKLSTDSETRDWSILLAYCLNFLEGTLFYKEDGGKRKTSESL